MLYTVYETINTKNGNTYIGCHKTKNKDDEYLGSGAILSKAIKKYGIQSFEKTVLYVFDNPEEMFQKEAELVNEEYIASSNTYNAKVGGMGGWDHINDGSEAHRERARRGGLKSCELGHFGKTKTSFIPGKGAKEISIKANVAKKQDMINNPEKYVDIYNRVSVYQTENNSMKNRRWCVPIDIELSEIQKFSKVFHIDEIPEKWLTVGEFREEKKRKNGVYGKFWIYNPVTEENRYTDDVVPEGWFKGRKMEYYKK